MKIRNGFVSNSSSSSFIISNEHFPVIKDIATYMINKQIEDAKYEIEDYKYFGTDQHDIERLNEYIEDLENQIKRLDKLDENQSISFPSCNYDTYIRKVGDCYLVSTCNNTQWNLWEYTTKLTDNAIEALEELKKLFPEEVDNVYNNYEFSRIGKDYYDLAYEVIGVITYDHCPNPHRDDYIWDTPKYGKICLICTPYFKRKGKLIEINKIADKQ